MILKASQRAGGRQLASHLLNDRDNEHVTVLELRGFAADDLHGAFQEAHAVSLGTKCKQYLFSVSLNPPARAFAKEDDFTDAADRIEERLRLDGQPRAIVIHEKEGRRHAHVVWSRIDAEEMRAVNMAHFKNKLTDLSRELFLDHVWPLPDGLRTGGGRSPLNFTLSEWQQARRTGRDPREIKDALRDAWMRSDSLPAFQASLEARGYFLAKGDRRGFVAVDVEGQVHSLSRCCEASAKDLHAKLGSPDKLPTVAETVDEVRHAVRPKIGALIDEMRTHQARELVSIKAEITRHVDVQRVERARMAEAQRKRWDEEARAREAHFRVGIVWLWDALTGRNAAVRRFNEGQRIEAARRDRMERNDLARLHAREVEPLQRRLDRVRLRHRGERKVMIREALGHWRGIRGAKHRHPDTELPHQKQRGLTLDL